MSRPKLKKLYMQLRESRFSFMSSGEHHIRDIYEAVSIKYRELCDDSFLCSANCRGGHNQPEWQHTVRRSLQAEKASGSVSRTGRPGFWQFP